MFNHLMSHHKHKDLKTDSTMHVVAVCTNPSRNQSRYRLFREFVREMESSPNVELHIVEGAFGDRHFEVTEECNPNHLQVRLQSEIWIKENLINLGVKHLLPTNWKYLSWVDGDVGFRNKDGWALEAIHQLQTFNVLQPWQQCVDLGPHGNIMQTFNSFGYIHQRGDKKQRHKGEPYIYAHSGFAWSCNRYFWEQVGGLFDRAVLGSADHHMAWAMIGQTMSTIHGKMGKDFFDAILEWQRKAIKACAGDVGYSAGRLEHHFHGPKGRRYYRERWQILVDHQFNPIHDLEYDAQGVLRLVGKPGLEVAIRKYNRSRMEDSIEQG